MPDWIEKAVTGKVSVPWAIILLLAGTTSGGVTGTWRGGLKAEEAVKEEVRDLDTRLSVIEADVGHIAAQVKKNAEDMKDATDKQARAQEKVHQIDLKTERALANTERILDILEE